MAGNSVGGDMTAALALMAKDRNGPKISYQVLLIPATDASVDTDSYHEYGNDRFLSRAFMKYGWDLYAPDEETRKRPLCVAAARQQAELKGLPPALVITAENDPLRDEGEAYARKLKEAGVEVAAVRYNGTIHDFVAERLAQPAGNRGGDATGKRGHSPSSHAGCHHPVIAASGSGASVKPCAAGRTIAPRNQCQH